MERKFLQKLIKTGDDVFRIKTDTGSWTALQTSVPSPSASDAFDCTNYRIEKTIKVKKIQEQLIVKLMFSNIMQTEDVKVQVIQLCMNN
jgi:hypothetical protein